MKNKNLITNLSTFKKILIASILSLIVLFTMELLAEKDTGFIEWRAIPAANRYRIEIKSDEKVIIETNVNENIYTILHHSTLFALKSLFFLPIERFLFF